MRGALPGMGVFAHLCVLREYHACGWLRVLAHLNGRERGCKQKGVLTPEEFVAAGDLLVDKCPSWSWEAGDPAKVGLPHALCPLRPLLTLSAIEFSWAT